jgi:hypothetical protein
VQKLNTLSGNDIFCILLLGMLTVGFMRFFTNGEVVPLLFLTEYHFMKAYWGVELQHHAFFDLGTRWRSASRSGALLPRERPMVPIR